MKRFLLYFSIVFFSIFIGSQITEGALLVPYWQSLSAADFYAYYNEFGPFINTYYAVLTIISFLLPIGLMIYCKVINSNAIRFAILSSVFAILFLSSFFMYFKGANESFFQASFSEAELKTELVTWSYWHWGRIVFQMMSLFFLILSWIKIQNNKIT